MFNFEFLAISETRHLSQIFTEEVVSNNMYMS